MLCPNKQASLNMVKDMKYWVFFLGGFRQLGIQTKIFKS